MLSAVRQDVTEFRKPLSFPSSSSFSSRYSSPANQQATSVSTVSLNRKLLNFITNFTIFATDHSTWASSLCKIIQENIPDDCTNHPLLSLDLSDSNCIYNLFCKISTSSDFHSFLYSSPEETIKSSLCDLEVEIDSGFSESSNDNNWNQQQQKHNQVNGSFTIRENLRIVSDFYEIKKFFEIFTSTHWTFFTNHDVFPFGDSQFWLLKIIQLQFSLWTSSELENIVQLFLQTPPFQKRFYISQVVYFYRVIDSLGISFTSQDETIRMKNLCENFFSSVFDNLNLEALVSLQFAMAKIQPREKCLYLLSDVLQTLDPNDILQIHEICLTLDLDPAVSNLKRKREEYENDTSVNNNNNNNNDYLNNILTDDNINDYNNTNNNDNNEYNDDLRLLEDILGNNNNNNSVDTIFDVNDDISNVDNNNNNHNSMISSNDPWETIQSFDWNSIETPDLAPEKNLELSEDFLNMNLDFNFNINMFNIQMNVYNPPQIPSHPPLIDTPSSFIDNFDILQQHQPKIQQRKQNLRSITATQNNSSANNSRPMTRCTTRLEVKREPPAKLVYNRVMRPFPAVMVLDLPEGSKTSEYFIKVELLRDNNAELPDCIEGQDYALFKNGGCFATFDKLKLLHTCMGMKVKYFKFKFSLLKWKVGFNPDEIKTSKKGDSGTKKSGKKDKSSTDYCVSRAGQFESTGIETVSIGFEVFSHSSYISGVNAKENKEAAASTAPTTSKTKTKQSTLVKQESSTSKPETGLAEPPTKRVRRNKKEVLQPKLIEILPDSGTVDGGERVCLLGKDFINSEKLKVKFGTVEVPASWHEDITILCTTPSWELVGAEGIKGEVEVKVSNDGETYNSTGLYFKYV
eukprot:TRINITY_DN5406_c0_g3_i1.p1 TRINITY_DN5406_c0_g3~~TRINITY_DN5406_c0_g3_i1.p1  ORF type:complete len:857 (-),score=183.64 TRINITY_DN5406_c0_g3_i1:112-2682(-)